ncbi:MAG: HesA/MoeB/ThiF family protein [Candidatus Hydrogenedentota bacterium]|nr:MAG: HesA/MoeB/ThiF family protein [Candidatus Hydrogenedentota bacterium]
MQEKCENENRSNFAVRIAKAVLVIGAGGLGCPALISLAEAGVPRLGIADPDNVEISNLPRQILFTENDLGRNKAAAAAEALLRFPGTRNLEIDIHATAIRGDEPFLEDYGVVIEAVDDPESKFLLHDAVVSRRIPFVQTSASGWTAQILTVTASGCLRCLFEFPERLDAPDCSRIGIAGPVAGLAGLLAAEEALAILSGRPPRFANRFWSRNFLEDTVCEHRITPRPDCPVCRAPS